MSAAARLPTFLSATSSARNLGAYYEALSIGPSHNYYEGRAKADITRWVEYFCEGVADSLENVRRRAQEAAGSGARDHSNVLRRLDPRQRRALELFRQSTMITNRDMETLFGIFSAHPVARGGVPSRGAS
jgi:hypothetical protein